MSTVADYGGAAIAIVRRDVQLFISYRFRLVSQVMAEFFTVSLFYFVSRLVHVGTFSSSDAYFGYAVVGIGILAVIGATLSGLPPALRQELVAGTFERLVVSPAGAVAGTVAMLAFPTLVALLMATVTVTFAATVFGMPLDGATAPLAIPIALLASAAFAPFALLIGGAVLAVKQAGTAAGFVVTGLSLVGGFFFPVSLLPPWIRWMSDVQPFTPALNLLRHALIGTPMTESAWISLLMLAGFAAVLLPLSIWFLQAAIHWAQRRGTVTEY